MEISAICLCGETFSNFGGIFLRATYRRYRRYLNHAISLTESTSQPFMTLVLLVFLLFSRLYSSFLDFAYPELDASSKKSYSDVEGWDRNLKIFVPFFSTVTTVVYNKLVEVLKKDAKRFP